MVINIKKQIFRFFDRKIFPHVINVWNVLKKRRKLPEKIEKVLVVREYALGETLLTLPMIKRLNDEGYEVAVFCSKTNKEVFKRVDFVNDILVFEEFNWIDKSFFYDVAIDTEPHHNISAMIGRYLSKCIIGFNNLERSKLYDIKIEYNDRIHAVYNFCNLLKPLHINYKPNRLIPLKCYDVEIKRVDKILKKLGLINKKLIGIHCSSAGTATWRRWKEEKFANLIDRLVERNYHIILTGTKADADVNKKVYSFVKNKEKVFDFSEYNLNLGEFAYLLTKFECFVSNDTGPMHLSAAMGVRTIGLFGPNLPERFGPFGPNNISIYKAHDLKCSPCINVHKREFGICKYNGKCMDLIGVEDVLKYVV